MHNQDVVAIVARQMDDAQAEHTRVLQAVERIQVLLNRKNVLLAEAGQRLINIEAIHNAITQD